MKILIPIILAALTVFQTQAADSKHWLTDVPKAKELAKKEKKMVLLDFTGSDWCPPCQALTKNVFSSKEFLDYAEKNLVLVELDFPQRKKQSAELKRANQELQRAFKIEGFPTVILLDSDGKEIHREVGYSGEPPKEYIAMIEKARKKTAGK